jgi:hypothetical protein
MDVPISLPYRDWIVVTSALARAAEVNPDSNHSRVHDALMEKMFVQAEGPRELKAWVSGDHIEDTLYEVYFRLADPNSIQKITMIKEFRQITGLSLKDAKDFVDSLKYDWVTHRDLARVNWLPLAVLTKQMPSGYQMALRKVL